MKHRLKNREGNIILEPCPKRACPQVLALLSPEELAMDVGRRRYYAHYKQLKCAQCHTACSTGKYGGRVYHYAGDHWHPACLCIWLLMVVENQELRMEEMRAGRAMAL